MSEQEKVWGVVKAHYTNTNKTLGLTIPKSLADACQILNGTVFLVKSTAKGEIVFTKVQTEVRTA